MKNLLITIISVAAVMISCTEGKTKLPGNLYPAEYTVIEGMPYDIQLNSHTTWERTDSYPDYSCLNFRYPEYGADGFLTAVTLDSARLLNTMNRYFAIMEMRADTICDIIENDSPTGIHSWIFVHPAGKEQLQWMATDSATMYVTGRIKLQAAADTTIDITPAIENIRADITHLINNLKPDNVR